jgi:hypothetical protein
VEYLLDDKDQDLFIVPEKTNQVEADELIIEDNDDNKNPKNQR